MSKNIQEAVFVGSFEMEFVTHTMDFSVANF
jgi:hypothetical protein